MTIRTTDPISASMAQNYDHQTLMDAPIPPIEDHEAHAAALTAVTRASDGGWLDEAGRLLDMLGLGATA